MINIAVTGCGYWGPNLIRNFHFLAEHGSKNSRCKLKKVCDTDKKRLSHIKSLYPDVDVTPDYQEIVSDPGIDAVVIATPVRYHYAMAKQSLEAGKHTFIEKPMASSVAECAELDRLARDKKLTLMVGHTFIYSPPVRRIREIIQSGDLGELLYISSWRLNLGLFQRDINVAWDLAPHDISIILFITKASPVSVNCQGKAHVTPKVEDVTNMSIHFDNGVFATIQNSWLNPNKIRKSMFVGKNRMLVYDDLEPLEKIKIYDQRVSTPPHYDTFAEFQYSYHYGDVYSPYIKQDEPLKVECQHFLDCIQSGQEPDSGGREGIQVVRIVEAACQSLHNDGHKVVVTD
ncbi:MAG: Gfo/Idh/MocA family protein [bacterium]